jgi:epoxyqueuosine reductase
MRAGSSEIVARSREYGASLAGIARVADLEQSSSYVVYDRSPYYDGYTGVEWPDDARSVLVLALAHPPSEPALDWWSDAIPGRTPGNRALMRISKQLRLWLGEDHGICARSLPYPVEAGGIFLKDAAALAGLGVIGKNNLLVTPELGTEVRLRALFLDVELDPTGPSAFDPCDGCDMPCLTSCPRGAFRSGAYETALCKLEMDQNKADSVTVEGSAVGIDEACEVAKYCRACEYACPVSAGNTRGPTLHQV